jgi:replicative DNA helicase
MDRTAALQELKAKLGPLDAYLRGRGIDIGANGRKHFRCLNPEHTDSTPSMNYLGGNVYCHGCKATYDIIDLMAAEKNMTAGQFIEWGYQEYGILPTGSITQAGKKADLGKPAPVIPDSPPAPKEDYSAYIDACHARIGELDLKQLRGLCSTIKRFKIGYDPAWHSHGNRGTWKALIIPKGKYAFTVRNMDPDADKNSRYDKTLGTHPIFNQEAFDGDAPVFITEGAFDALSIMEVGGEAVALEGLATGKLLQLLEQKKPAKPVILALDNDQRGQETEAELIADLSQRGIPFLQADLTGDRKDANEAFNSLEAVNFIQAVQNTINSIKSEEDRAREETRARYQGITAAANLEAFFAETKKGRKAYPTGFSLLDEQLRGGLFEGLTIVGAITSAGKTTLAMQMADYMAQAGHDVLIFSLETSRHELMARSISRETLVKSFMNRESIYKGMTFRDIMDGEPGEMLEAASTAYSQYAGHLYIFQSLGKIGTRRIRAEVEGLTNEKGAAPVVIVDYLQLLGPNEGERFQGAKETMDAAVTDLKCLAVDFKTPVILISSFNRDNYSKDANLASFKESGGIEYSADLLLGLQYEGAGKQGWNQEKAEQAADMNPRKMELKIMKNRNGAWGQRISMDYYAPFNFFREIAVKKGRDK